MLHQYWFDWSLERDERGRRGIAGGPLPRLGAFWIQRSLGFLEGRIQGCLKRGHRRVGSLSPVDRRGTGFYGSVSDGLFPSGVSLKQLPALLKTRGLTQVTVSGVPTPALSQDLWGWWGAGVTVHGRWRNSRIDHVYRKQARHAIFPSDMKKCDLSRLSWWLRIIELVRGDRGSLGKAYKRRFPLHPPRSSDVASPLPLFSTSETKSSQCSIRGSCSVHLTACLFEILGSALRGDGKC